VGGYTELLRRAGRQRWFAALGPRIVPLDRWIQRRSGGRVTLSGRPGLPQVLLTTAGSKSGRPRTVPVLAARDGDSWVAVASNWGQKRHPAWSGNLLANRLAVVTVGKVEVPVRAVLAEGAERDRLWDLAVAVWPGYTDYAERSDRDLRIFRLVPRGSEGRAASARVG
jgi:deazaflavin-dependent oxidoreductase (nitroreductase family)